jgi:ABC-2 type transport system permease protein
MSPSYSQFKAFSAVTKAAFRSIAKSPSSVVFTIAFPLIFILVFGFLGGSGAKAVKVTMAPGADTANALYAALGHIDIIRLIPPATNKSLEQRLAKGEINAVLDIQRGTNAPAYRIAIRTMTADVDKANQLNAVLEKVILQQDPAAEQRIKELLTIEKTTIQSRKFTTIDFILPGQLGFSLLASSVFGTAFVFFNLRQSLVLKRFFATPVRREYIILAEGCARMIFQLLGAAFIILVGRFFLGFTLVHEFLTFVNMLLICALGLLVFMSFGFIISGVARSEATIPPLSNLITLPQFLLAGTFFSIEAFPSWMQPVSKALPLTYLNDALRQVAFDGASLWDVRMDIGVLLLWGVIGYFAASRVFKWE